MQDTIDEQDELDNNPSYDDITTTDAMIDEKSLTVLDDSFERFRIGNKPGDLTFRMELSHAHIALHRIILDQ